MTPLNFPTLNPEGIYIIDGATRVPDPKRKPQNDRPQGTGIIEIHPILNDENVVIERRCFTSEDVDQLCIITFDRPDTLNVFASQNYVPGRVTLTLQVNQSRYEVRMITHSQVLVLITQGGDDRIHIEDDVTVPVTVFSGEGNDRIVSAGKVTCLYAGAGNDFVAAIRGSSHIEAGDGDDEVHAHQDTHVTIYGGRGNDDLSGGEGSCFIDGGEGDDHIVGGRGSNILSGADGDDRIEAGPARNVIYTGLGLDQVTRLKAQDVTYFSQNSNLTVECALSLNPLDPGQFGPGELTSHAIHSEPQPLINCGVSVKGTAEFINRVNDDLRLLLTTPTGQKLLAQLKRAEQISGKPITVHEFFPTPNGLFMADPPNVAPPFITDNKRGTPSYGGKIWYNTTDIVPGIPSIINLFHELCHAYNHVTGTLLQGASPDGKPGSALAPNAELQAVGIPTSAPPFDFDENPDTPPTTTNPLAFSENGLRKELGIPPREHYLLKRN